MSSSRIDRRVFHTALASSFAALATPSSVSAGSRPTAPPNEDPVAAACAHPARIEMDTKRDATRQPQRILDFFQIRPGQRVADIQAGNGYYTELLSRIVGKSGRVLAVNSSVTQRLYGKQLTSRLRRESFDATNVERIDRELDEMELPEDLDRVLLVRFYHDFGWMEQDRGRFNDDVYDSLRPGGIFGIIDHHAKEGAGMSVGQKLHRVEASLVREEVEVAGFELEAESYVLNDPTDGRDFNIFANQQERRDRTDRFVYLFRKPE